MATLQYVGIDTSLYTNQTAVQPDLLDSDDNRPPDDRLPDDCDDDVQLDGVDVTPNDNEPLLFFYDYETTGGSYQRDHIIEVAATVVVPDGLHITSTQFSSLCHTSCHIAWKGNINTYISLMHHFFFTSVKEVWDNPTHVVQPANVFNCTSEAIALDKLLHRRSRATKKYITLSWYGITQMSYHCQ